MLLYCEYINFSAVACINGNSVHQPG